MSEPDLPNPHTLHELGEHMAAGYFELPDASPTRRWCRAVRRELECRETPAYTGTQLYPNGPLPTSSALVTPSYSFTYIYNRQRFATRLENADPAEAQTLRTLDRAMVELDDALSAIRTVHKVGGKGYTHSIPNYGRVCRQGLDGYGQRIAARLALARRQADTQRIDLYEGLQDVLAGLRAWHAALILQVESAQGLNDDGRHNQRRLLQALEQVPFDPAEGFFQALVAYNWTFYADGCDNPGRIDQELWPYYRDDLTQGRIDRDTALALFRELWRNVDDNSGWSTGIGGTTSDGEPAYNELTLICLEAAQHMRRPNLQLHVRRDMPDAVWEAALNTIATGCGLPALYNEEAFITGLRDTHLGLGEADLGWYNGGGCTETMIHGCSNVGSLDAGINLPLVLTDVLHEHLPTALDFPALLAAFKEATADTVREITNQVSAYQQAKAEHCPQPIRSLLVDDCIDSGVEFNAGGARYNWSVVNVAGLANVVDSLAAIRELVYERAEMSGRELAELLARDLSGAQVRLEQLTHCPRFGNDDPRADGLAVEIATFVFSAFLRYAPWRGGKFLPSCIMFTTYAKAGAAVPPTPDGRHHGDPIADSAGPYQGRDRSGPTAMLRSVAKLPHELALGTLVVNARFHADMLRTPANRDALRALIRAYFDLGGMQLQINVVDQAVIRDAIVHPEHHQDLIVRVGGYSEYFNRLSDPLKLTFLQRTEHTLS